MTDYTKLPWTYSAKLSGSENHRGYFVRAQLPGGRGTWAFAEVQPGDPDGKAGEQICRLIAAAPELLEALRDCMRRIDDGADYGPDHAVTKARAAIKKATGEA